MCAHFSRILPLDILLQAAVPARGQQASETPTGALMRGHGLAERIMLIYERTVKDWKAGEKIDLSPVNQAARMARSYISGCHEQCEERYLFPLFREEGYLSDIVDTLSTQHQAGGEVTDKIIDLSSPGKIKDETHMNILMTLCRSYVFMYRPHMSRENTELFPRLYEIAPRGTVDELREKINDAEQKLAGEKGFRGLLNDLAGAEQSLGIADIAGYTIGYG